MQELGQRNWQLDRGYADLTIFKEILPDEQGKNEPQDLQSNQPKKSLIKKQGRPKTHKNSNRKLKKSKEDIPEEKKQRGHWSLEENKRYHWFLQIYHLHFIHKEMRRLDKIFKTMALFIGSRQAEQCRSHHQKMETKFHDFSKILLHLRQEHYGNEDYQPVLRDIQGLEVEGEVAVLSFGELKILQTERKEKLNEMKKKEEEKQENEGEKKGEQKNNLVQDILGDNYEVHFDMNNLLI